MPIALNHLRAIAGLLDVVSANVAMLRDLDGSNPERCAALEAADLLAKRAAGQLQLRIEQITRDAEMCKGPSSIPLERRQ